MTYCNSCNSFRCRVGCTGKSVLRRGNSNANLADAALDSLSYPSEATDSRFANPVPKKSCGCRVGVPECCDTCQAKLSKPLPVKPKAVNDAINHPAHYTSHPSGIECIDVTEHMGFTIGNAIKYLWRAGIKSEKAHVEDLRKAVWYINREISRLEKGK